MSVVELIIAGAAIELESRLRCHRERSRVPIELLVACWHVADVGRGWR